MKKAIISLTILTASLGLAQAHGNNGVQGSAGLGGQVTIYQGSVGGNAGASSNSSSITSTLINGSGKAIEKQANQTGATGSIGGTIGKNGVAVSSNGSTFSNSQAFGKTSGDGVVTKQGGSVTTGGTSFGDSESQNGVTSRFDKAAVGGNLTIGGFAQLGGF